MKNRAIGLLALLAATPFAAAQGEDVPPPLAPGFDQALSTWRESHGEGWRALVDRTTGHLALLYGYHADAPFVADPAVDDDWFALAHGWVQATQGLHGIDPKELVDDRVVYLPMGIANGTDKITVRLRQNVLGLPVENGVVNALFDTDGRLLSLQSTSAPNTAQLVLAPQVQPRVAVDTARRAFEASVGVPALANGPALLQIAQVERGATRDALLTYRIEVHNTAEPAGKAYIVDALTGLVLREDELIHYFDVTGTIKSMATPGSEADHAGNPPTDMPMSYIDVHGSNGQTVQTDRDGNFNFPGVNSALNLTVDYEGTFNNVNNQAGSDYSITFNNVQPNNPVTLLMNPSPTEYVTAQANTYQHMNVLRDYIRDTTPGDSTGDFKALSNPNIDSSCNAYFNGNSVNYYRKAGSCNNTGFSSVVAHELGHWLNVKYGTGNGSDGMGEGNADMFAMYVYDDHIVGRYFTTSGGFVRTGLNTRQFCGDGNPGCHGGVHADGEVWMGAGWKVRRNLKSSLGTGLGGATADQLFMGWMNSYNQTQIKSVIETQWLTLDDDNGNIGDGTPNYQDIDSAFLEQGFPGHDLDFFTWTNVTQLPDVSDDVGPYAVSADVVAMLVPPVTGVDLNWSVNGGGTQTVAMSNSGGNTWTGDIAALGGLGFVEYWLTATDNGGNDEDYPTDGPPFTFFVGVITYHYFNDFEGAGDEGWTHGQVATQDDWHHDVAGGKSGDPSTAYSGQRLWGNDLGPSGWNGAYQPNVNNWLRSPVLDLSAASNVHVRYQRWLTVEDAAFDQAQIRVNGLPVWQNQTGAHTLDSAWTLHTVDVSTQAAGNASVQIEYRLMSDSGLEFGGWNLDDFSVVSLDPVGCPAPTNYCQTSANSAGPGALISSNGDTSIAANNFELQVVGAPAGQFGLFYYGPDQTSVPLGEGLRCVDGSLFRLPVVSTDVFGQAAYQVDFGALPPGGDILVGSVWNFQFWYRDPPGGGTGFNLSDALEATFCD